MVGCSPKPAIITPQAFLQETLDLVKGTSFHPLLQRYVANPRLSYRDVQLLLEQILPKSIFREWKPVTFATKPLPIAEMHPYNDNFSIEWYYLNANGFLSVPGEGLPGEGLPGESLPGESLPGRSLPGGSLPGERPQRYYLLHMAKRIRARNPKGIVNAPWLMSAAFSLVVVPPNGGKEGKPIHVEKNIVAPCFTEGVPECYQAPPVYFLLRAKPTLRLTLVTPKGSSLSYTLGLQASPSPYHFELNYSDVGHTFGSGFNKGTSPLALGISCLCDKPLLLQGPQRDGLDPAGDTLLSDISGASYLYYSWPSWILKPDAHVNFVTLGSRRLEVDADAHWNLWLDHQGGNVLQPTGIAKVGAELTGMMGLRPLVFPGWNWIDIQLFDGRQFTGYSNKPWNNDPRYNTQQIKGTFSPAQGENVWVSGILEIQNFWKSESGVHYGVDYRLQLGEHGTFLLKAIAEDQRVTNEGIENYEGGADVFLDGGGTTKDHQIGFGNIECVGWTPLKTRIDDVSRQLVTPLTPEEATSVYDGLALGVGWGRFVMVLVLVLLAVMVYLLVRLGARLLGHRGWVAPLGGSFLLAALLAVAIFMVLRDHLCGKLKTCDPDRLAMCWTCRP